MTNLYVISGDDYLSTRRLTISGLGPDGLPVDLTGAALTFQVRRRSMFDPLITKTDQDGIAIASPQTGATKGVVYVEIAAADTADLDGRYLWELEAVDAIGHVTLGSGGFYVQPDLIAASADNGDESMTTQMVEIAFDLAGLDNPDGNGAEVMDLPAASFVQVGIMVTTPWVEGVLVAYIAETADGPATAVAGGDASALIGNAPGVLNTTFPNTFDNTQVPRWVYVSGSTLKVFVGYFGATASVGVAKVYAIIVPAT